MYFLQLPNMLIIFLFLAAKSCDHYAADILFTCSMTTFVTAKSTNQPLISFEHVNHVMREVISFDSCAIRHFGLFRFNSDWTRQFFYQDFWRCILPISTPLTTVMSQCRQNYHEECEAGINKQINLELYASYVYLSMVGFVMKHSLISVGEPELNAYYSCLKGLSLRSWWCGACRIPQVHAETVEWRTRTRSKGKSKENSLA